MSAQSDTMERVEESTDLDLQTSSDKPESAHYVMSPDDAMSNHDYVTQARILGTPVTALCGFTWVPSRSAANLPVCQECVDIWNSLPDTGGGLPRE